MKYNIKYLIESLQKFNPSDYNDNEDDIIDNKIINDLTDPVSLFINYIGQFNWKVNINLTAATFPSISNNENLPKIWTNISSKIEEMIDTYDDSDEELADVKASYSDYGYGQAYIISICTEEQGIEFYYYIDNKQNRDYIGFLQFEGNSGDNFWGKVPVKVIDAVKTNIIKKQYE